METFSQRDSRWADKRLGGTTLSMRDFGCFVTAIAQGMALSGHAIDPGKLVDMLNAADGFTDTGLLKWAKVHEVVPEAVLAEVKTGPGKTFVVVKGELGRYLHWVLKDGETIYDPLFGAQSYPVGYKPTGRVLVLTVVPKEAPAPAPTPPAPTPTPEPTPEPEFDEYTVKPNDSLSKITSLHYGLSLVGGKNSPAYKKAIEVAAFNGIENPDLIFPGQVIKLPK